MNKFIVKAYLTFAFLLGFSLTLKAAPLPQKIEAKNLLTNETVQILTQEIQKKGTVLIFMSSKCPCSDSHASLIKELIEKYKDFAFYIIHSNANEDETEAKKYFASKEFKTTILQDDSAKIADIIKAYKTPHAFIINDKGEIVYKGGVTDSNNALKADKQYLAAALEDIANDRVVKNSETKALGCFISREKE